MPLSRIASSPARCTGRDRVGGAVSDAEHGQLDDPLHARSLRRGDEPLIVCGDVEPVGEQEHRVYTVERGCQIAVAEIGHDLLGAVGENRARIAGEDPYVACLGRGGVRR